MNSQAEIYIGGQIGAAIPLSFQSVEGTGRASGTDGSSIPLNTSVLYGGKVGYFFPSIMDWLGVEADVTHKNPNMKSHAFTLTRPDGSTTSVVEGLNVSMTTLALRAVVRTPDIDGWGGFQPYVGVGPAFFFARTSTGSSSSADTGLGFSFQAGSRYFLTRELALFAEYKFDAAMLKFQDAVAPGAGFNGDYNTHNIAVGVSYHFRTF
jgi:opacity protein-like surface antigen